MLLSEAIARDNDAHDLDMLLVPARQEWEETQKLAEFGRQMLADVKECITELAFNLSAEHAADKAVACGLMQYVAYDPAQHGTIEDMEPGDMIYYWGTTIRKAGGE